MNSDRPTQPPAEADDKALAFSARVVELERGRHRPSGLLRVLAEAWAETNGKPPIGG